MGGFGDGGGAFGAFVGAGAEVVAAGEAEVVAEAAEWAEPLAYSHVGPCGPMGFALPCGAPG